MHINNIEKVVIEYLDTQETDYAILVNGGWGSGKTFYWKDKLSQISDKKGFKPIYISLNGMRKVEDIEHAIFTKLIPIIGQNETPALKLLANAANQLGKAFLGTSFQDLFKGVSLDTFNFSKFVICFDDLERCRIPMVETLGYINNYVEHRKLKAIFLSDESNIQEGQEIYKNVKEKLIRRILNFELDLEDSLPLFFDTYKHSNPSFFDFLSTKKEQILALTSTHKLTNLRTISFYLEVVSKLFLFIEDSDEKCQEEILFFSFAICNEF